VDDVNVQEQHAAEQPELTTADLAGVKTPPASPPMESQRGEQTLSNDQRSSSLADKDATPLFAQDEAADLRGKWDGIQAGFVDEPRRAVEEADNLVAAVMTRLAEIFASERKELETQWDRGDDVTTEDLRLALRRYRSFFSRLLSV
jgi:hypothetical protein